jgi:phage-related protein
VLIASIAIHSIIAIIIGDEIMWKIVFLDKAVEEEFQALTLKAKAKFDRIEDLIRLYGLENIGRPYVAPVADKIWEIRLKTSDSNARGLYATKRGKVIVILRFFEKKSQKIPKNEFSLARERLKKISDQDSRLGG